MVRTNKSILLKALCVMLALIMTMSTVVVAGALTASADNGAFKSITHKIKDGVITFTVVTAAGDYNRVKASLESNPGGSVGVSNNYTVNTAGDYVWTVKFAAPEETTTYAFDLRTTANKYLKNYTMYTVTVKPNTTPVKSVTHSYSGSKLVFKVVTRAGDYNRIKAGLATAPSGSQGVGVEYKVNADGDWVWTVKVAVPTETTTYAFDMRGTDGKYLKNYFEYEVSMDNTIKYAKYTEYQGRLMITVVTKAGDYNRLRCGLSTGTKDNLANANTYTVDDNGDFVWLVKTPRPVEDSTLYLDLRNATTNTYIKEFCMLDVEGASVYYNDVDHTDSDNWNQVVNNIYTAPNGGFQFYAPGWKTYGMYSIAMVPEAYENTGTTNAISVAVYGKDSGSYDDYATFQNKTKESFETVLQEKINTFE